MIGKTISHYKIIEKLGEGGMGVVYKAEDTKLNRKVALKFLPPSFSTDEESKQRFIHEAQSASGLEHNNICTIHEIDEDDNGRLFIVMSCYEGETLKEKLENGPVEVEKATGIVKQISEGLSAAHNKGIIHRDIKPANIFITNEGIVKILDFGLAKSTTSNTVTQMGITSGTVAYMSPEQSKGEKVDHRTDIWALGVVFYQMLTGELPFKADYDQAVIYSIINDEYDKETIDRIIMDDGISNIINKSLVKNPSERFQSFSDILNLLDKKSNYKLNKQLSLKKTLLRHRYTFGILVLLLTTILIWYYLQVPLSLKSNEYVIITDFINNTGETFFDHSLTEGFKFKLSQSPHVNIFSKYKTAEALRLLTISDNSIIDKEIAIKIAKREAVPFVVTGQIDKIGNSYLLSCGIIDVPSEEIIKYRSEEAERIDNVFSAMDQITEDIRYDLGESMSSIETYSKPLAKVTSGSIEALELFSKGNLLEAEGNYSDAIEFKERAVKIDSLFVNAISDLSYNYYKTGDHKKAIHYHNRVLPLIDRVSEREKYSILTIYYGSTFERDYIKAYEYANKWTLLYPNDAVGHGTLAHLAMFTGNYEKSLEANNRALSLDSSFSGVCHNNIGYTYALMGKPDNALKYFDTSKELRPDYYAIDQYISRVLWMDEREDSAENRFISTIPKIQNGKKDVFLALLTSLYYYNGDLDRAEEICLQGINLCKVNGSTSSEAYFHYLFSEISIKAGDRNKFHSELKRSISLSELPYIEYGLAGISYAENGYYQESINVLNKLNLIKSDDPHFLQYRKSFKDYINGYLLLNEGKYDSSRSHIANIKELYCGDPIYLLSRKLYAKSFESQNDSLAINYYKNLLAKKGEIFMSYFPTVRNGGTWIAKLWFGVYYEIGKIYSLRGDKKNAEIFFNQAQGFLNNSLKEF